MKSLYQEPVKTLFQALISVAIIAVITGICAFYPSIHSDGEAVTNATIIKMTSAGLSDELIVRMILHSPTMFNTSKDALNALKSAHVSPVVMAEITGTSTSAPGAHEVFVQEEVPDMLSTAMGYALICMAAFLGMFLFFTPRLKFTLVERAVVLAIPVVALSSILVLHFG